MTYERTFCQRLLEHLFVVGQVPADSAQLATDCHVYLIVGDGGATAVDAGGGRLWPFVQAAARRYGFADLPISHVLVTYGHGDHAGGLTDFENQGALTVCSEYTAEHLDSVEDADLVFGAHDAVDLSALTVETIPTPGHTPGSTTYALVIDGQACLFTGDLVQMDGGLGWCGSDGFSQVQVLASLEMLASRPRLDWLLAGHGWTQAPVELLSRAISFGRSGQWVVWTDRRPEMPG